MFRVCGGDEGGGGGGALKPKMGIKCEIEKKRGGGE